MQYWSSERRGGVEIATYSNPPNNIIATPVILELDQIVTGWQDPAIRAVVLQSLPQGTAGFRRTASKSSATRQATLHSRATPPPAYAS